MAKYHINGEGDPGKCRAKAQCPFGGEGQHYESADQARAVYEASQASFTTPAVHRNASAAAHYEALAYGAEIREFEVSTAIDSAFHGAYYKNSNPAGVAAVAAIVARLSDAKRIDDALSTPIYELPREDSPAELRKYLPVINAGLSNPALSTHSFNRIAAAAYDGKFQSGDARNAKRELIQTVLEDKRCDRIMRKQLKRELTAIGTEVKS